MIPKIIHRVWPGQDPIPYTFRRHGTSFETHNPEWTHRLWTLEDLDGLEMQNRDLYDQAKTEAPDDWIRWRADIARLEIIYQHGGIYVDTDAECLRPLDALREFPCWFAESPNASGYATQAVFGAEPGHPFIKRLLDEMQASADTNKGVLHRVGARYVNRVYQSSDIELLPWQWFSAQSIKARDAGKPPYQGFGYVNHRYFNSDRHNAKPQIAAYRAAADTLDGIEWFLTCGLLLGHIREGRILPWDTDVDIGVWPEDLDRVREAFSGWAVTRDNDDQIWAVHGKTKIDIHTHHRGEHVVVNLGKGVQMSYPAHLFDLQPTVFYMRETLIPSPPEEYLAHQYGDDWLTPKKKWRWDKDPQNLL